MKTYSLLFSICLLLAGSAAAAGTWTMTGPLNVGRDGHTTTLLPDGKVLVTGGFGHPNIVKTAELYDPAPGTWTVIDGPNNFRWRHTATLLPNGKVLVAGGATVATAIPSELYDPVLGAWTPSGKLNDERSDHTATMLPNGKVLVAGGGGNQGGGLYSAELYDPTSGTWTATGSLSTARSGHTATLLLNGKVLVTGGNFFSSAELYDPALGTWAPTDSLSVGRAAHTATLLPNGKVLVAGGYNNSSINIAGAELYDPAMGTWTPTGDLNIGRSSHTATLLSNGNVLVAAGEGGPNEDVLYSAELYDPTQETWTIAAFLNTDRILHTATVLPDGKVMVVGGVDDNLISVANVELYAGPLKPPDLLNISTRMRVLTADQVLIGGFIVTGTDLKRVLIRGIGPSLDGVAGRLSDPTLELHQGDVTIATNDNWKTRANGTSQQADIEATRIPPANDSESAILAMLSPGAYTVILAGKNEGTGVGLVEVYDLGQGANAKPVNISTRGLVDTGDNVMIGGFIVGGGSSGGTARVIVRALGPSLTGSGVANALADPILELHDGNGALIASNDNWRTDQEAEIIATNIPPSNDLESAIVRDLAPGNYTAIVRGVNNTTGVALVEAYGLN